MIHVHFGDTLKVAMVNSVAFALSFTDLEAIIRVAGLFAALVYTCLKIGAHFKEQREKAATGLKQTLPPKRPEV